MKKSKFFIVLALAAVLCFASIVPAFAQFTTNEHGAIMAPDELTITKTLRLPIGTITPTATFNFLAERVTVDGNPGTTANMPSLNNLTVSFSPPDVDQNAPDANNIMTITKPTGNIFAGVTFPHAGIFVYEITEIPNTNPSIDDPDNIHEWLNYSGAKYTLTVYVANNAAGTFISAVGIVVNIVDNAG